MMLPVLAGVIPVCVFGLIHEFKVYRGRSKMVHADVLYSKRLHMQFAVVTTFVVLFLVYPSVLKELFYMFQTAIIYLWDKSPDVDMTSDVKDRAVQAFLEQTEQTVPYRASCVNGPLLPNNPTTLAKACFAFGLFADHSILVIVIDMGVGCCLTSSKPIPQSYS